MLPTASSRALSLRQILEALKRSFWEAHSSGARAKLAIVHPAPRDQSYRWRRHLADQISRCSGETTYCGPAQTDDKE
jgi:hypothetical protein